MYFKCDGTPSIDTKNRIKCDKWSTVTETELLDNVIQQYRLSAEDYTALSSFTLVLFAVAFGIKAKIRVARPEPETY
jgi:hypothetical protein